MLQKLLTNQAEASADNRAGFDALQRGQLELQRTQNKGTPSSGDKRARIDDGEGPAASSSSSSSSSSAGSAGPGPRPAHRPAGGAAAPAAAAGVRLPVYGRQPAEPFKLHSKTELKDLVEDLVTMKRVSVRAAVATGATALRATIAVRYPTALSDDVSDARDALAFMINGSEALSAADEEVLLADPKPALQMDAVGASRSQSAAANAAAEAAHIAYMNDQTRRHTILSGIKPCIIAGLKAKVKADMESKTKHNGKLTMPEAKHNSLKPYKWETTVNATTAKLKEFFPYEYPFTFEPRRGGGGGGIGQFVGNVQKSVTSYFGVSKKE